MLVCINSKQNVLEHFVELNKVLEVGNKAKMNVTDYKLSPNLFRISLTNQKLKNDNINNEVDANKIHYNMGKDIRNFIKMQGGTMPEDLPTPSKSLKQLGRKK